MIKVGMDIILELDREDRSEKFKAKIADFSEGKIYITYPISSASNKVIFLMKEEELFVSFSDKETGGAYLFRTKVLGQIKNPIPLLVLFCPEETKFMKIQRREFVRVKTTLDVSLQFPIEQKYVPTVTEDLSAGGCSVINRPHIQIKKGEVGNILLVLPFSTKEYVYLNITCRVVRNFEKKGVSLISLQFLNVTDQEQQQMIRYTFEKQLEYRKRGIAEIK
ncbi:flagellar brake domain-containing protein [Lederbergia sp. NSJ-179]|uniref:flagellar brake protein n=1 Tax=Lederbergia sp. NSJ-179 TaxID=2931402 RepID=UPI001FD50EA8|nr:flagellar brake domain-containing protein [Lederbergia sp. NSJ-179]MCJ7839444.1 flagellar brake domain-containing protein [Lederbergia sp. NSJ-179]